MNNAVHLKSNLNFYKSWNDITEVWMAESLLHRNSLSRVKLQKFQAKIKTFAIKIFEITWRFDFFEFWGRSFRCKVGRGGVSFNERSSGCYASCNISSCRSQQTRRSSRASFRWARRSLLSIWIRELILDDVGVGLEFLEDWDFSHGGGRNTFVVILKFKFLVPEYSNIHWLTSPMHSDLDHFLHSLF